VTDKDVAAEVAAYEKAERERIAREAAEHEKATGERVAGVQS
jgi:hypothetical protein